jgi:hypothetical protein
MGRFRPYYGILGSIEVITRNMIEYIKKLTGGGKTLALGGAAVLVKILAPIAQKNGWEIPEGAEDAVATILLFLMGFVGLGNKNIKVDEKAEIANANISVLGNQVASLQAAEDDRKKAVFEAKRRDEEAQRKAAEDAALKAVAEARAAEEAKEKAEEDEKERLKKEVEELKKQLQNVK